MSEVMDAILAYWGQSARIKANLCRCTACSLHSTKTRAKARLDPMTRIRKGLSGKKKDFNHASLRVRQEESVALLILLAVLS